MSEIDPDFGFEQELLTADEIIFETFRNVKAIFSNSRQPIQGIYDHPENEVVTKGRNGQLIMRSEIKTLTVQSHKCPPLSADMTIKIGENVYFPIVSRSYDNGSGHYVIALGDEPLDPKVEEGGSGGRWR